ncbi:MAG: SMC-Scp complex subunit ScpB [Planctomycetaceae bacterium]|nr:SMC-Scp complex subunit ScpB [Planctomycetaceae bacterium]
MDDDLTVDEIEAAYLRALEVAEAAEALFPTPEQLASLEIEEAAVATAEDDPLPWGAAEAPVDDAIHTERDADDPPESQSRRLESWQVIEALLFVGGQPLTGRHLAEILGGSHTHEQVDELVEQLNIRYFSEKRPYEIRLGEGGYRMLLRPEFDAVRSRVFGQGPKEVKLSQDALEVLAFIAYQQPVSKEQVAETGKPGAQGLLRQLLRRELIALDRVDGEEHYITTKRFLEVFGLVSIDDLPLAIDFNFK